jgi:flagellar assembly protein FliH
MRLFKPVLKPSEAEGQILNYQPRHFQKSMPDQAVPFIRDREQDPQGISQFSINPLVAETTGVTEQERRTYQEKLETEVLARLKAIEEKAFGEAYALGMQDGREKAFNDSNDEIKSALESLGHAAGVLTNLKQQLFVDNEAHFIKTIFHIAKALAMKEINESPDAVINVLKKAVENAQSEEEITIRLNPKDNEFLQTVKKDAGNPLEKIPRLKFEISETVTRGGCMVETNYGLIDASVEQRISKLWTVLESKIPKITEG